MQVEGQHFVCLQTEMATGARVSNAYAICLQQGDNPEKSGLIPHNVSVSHEKETKGNPVADGHASH